MQQHDLHSARLKYARDQRMSSEETLVSTLCLAYLLNGVLRNCMGKRGGRRGMRKAAAARVLKLGRLLQAVLLEATASLH